MEKKRYGSEFWSITTKTKCEEYTEERILHLNALVIRQLRSICVGVFIYTFNDQKTALT